MFSHGRSEIILMPNLLKECSTSQVVQPGKAKYMHSKHVKLRNTLTKVWFSIKFQNIICSWTV